LPTSSTMTASAFGTSTPTESSSTVLGATAGANSVVDDKFDGAIGDAFNKDEASSSKATFVAVSSTTAAVASIISSLPRSVFDVVDIIDF